MIKTSAIKTTNIPTLSVVWDTGRRCNYDCSYCEATRHNNFSKPKPFEEFKKTFDFIKDWAGIYNLRRKNPSNPGISFTGGEPTANPNFWKLIDYIRSFPEHYYLSLTTNGAWDKKYSKKIIENFGGVTVSYHAEADETLKKNVIRNIKELAQSTINLQVNVMLHVDYWDETVQVYKDLKEQGIICNLRPIGDGSIVRKGWFIDTDGRNRRTSHEYTIEQQTWFWKEMGLKEIPTNVSEGNQLGRKCCGNIPLEGKVDGNWQPIKLIDTHFKNWHCMVDWFFLYIDQETQNVYHHQTCKAFYDNTTGPIGNLTNSDQILSELKERLSEPVIKSIVCPNTRCGCGMCVPKAQTLEDFKILQESIIL
jgi:MoaA/NifB/PqqE/SkfB family radical SAM enzyme